VAYSGVGFEVVAVGGCFLSHRLRVCWKRSILPWVCGWWGLPCLVSMPRVASSVSKPQRPFLVFGGEDSAVVGEDGCGEPPLCGGLVENGDDMGGGCDGYGGAGHDGAGVVIDEGDDFGVAIG